MELLIGFLMSVAASVVGNYVSKWLDQLLNHALSFIVSKKSGTARRNFFEKVKILLFLHNNKRLQAAFGRNP